MSTPIDFLIARRSVPAAGMTEPGPDDADLERMLTAALRVPDHGKLAPWRFILFQGDERLAAGEALLRLRQDRGDQLTAEESAAERDRFCRAPLVIGVVSRAASHPKIPLWEQQLSAGAVCMNLLNGAHALGFVAQWLTDWPVYVDAAGKLLGLEAGERFAGFVYIGSFSGERSERFRPSPADVTTRWKPPGPTADHG